jgi:hypothetical protein
VWEIDFFWTRSWLCLAGAALTVALFALTCKRSSRGGKQTVGVSCHHTPRGPAR